MGRDRADLPFRRPGTLLGAGAGGLAALVRRARRLEAVQREAAAFLGLPLAAHARVANVSGEVLVLLADGPAWAARLRFQARALAAHLNARFGLRIARTRVRIAPPRPTPAPRGRAPIPPAGREALARAARTVTDPDLRAALQRLARRGSKNGASGA